MKFGQTAPSRDPFYKITRKGGKTSGTFTLQTHERPKMKVFLKTPSKFASKNQKMAKNRGCFLETFLKNQFK